MAVIVHKYKPRSYFNAFHKRTQRFAVLVIHRRAGKTVAVVNDMVVRAMRTKKKDWVGAYVAPYFGEAKKIAWKYIKGAVANIPGCKVHESRTTVSFPNGAEISIFGADNPDALRGLYFDFVVLDEIAEMKKRVYSEIIRPAIADRRGSIVFLGTPKGKNFLYELVQKAKERSDRYFFLHLTVEDTVEDRPIAPAELVDMKEDLDEAEWNQEMMCSFEAALRGSYYSKQLQELRKKKCIGLVEYVPTEPVYVAMDVGRADATAIWFWQVIDGWVHVIDYFESVGMDADETCDVLEDRPYRYAEVWLPHDAFHKTWSSKKSGFDTFITRGLPARKVPNPDHGNEIYHGVDACRRFLRKWPVKFDEKRTAQGLEALTSYSRKYDNEKQVFADKPQHDKWSHGADGFRYMVLSINPALIGLSKERAERKSQHEGRVNKSASRNVTSYTYAEAMRDHDRKVAARKRNQHRVRY